MTLRDRLLVVLCELRHRLHNAVGRLECEIRGEHVHTGYMENVDTGETWSLCDVCGQRAPRKRFSDLERRP